MPPHTASSDLSFLERLDIRQSFCYTPQALLVAYSPAFSLFHMRPDVCSLRVHQNMPGIRFHQRALESLYANHLPSQLWQLIQVEKGTRTVPLLFCSRVLLDDVLHRISSKQICFLKLPRVGMRNHM